MGVKRKHSLEQEREIVLRYSKGVNQDSLARRFDCCRRTIQLILLRNGMAGLLGSRKFSDVEEVIIAHLYNEGFLQQELEELFQCAAPTLREVLKRQNVTMRYATPKYVPTPKQIKAATKKIRANWSESIRHERENQRGYVRVPNIVKLTRPRAGHTPSSV